MIISLNIALFILLILAFYQDRKQRSIHVLNFIALAIVSVTLFILNDFNWRIVLMNLIFTVVVISGLILYLSLKEKRPVNIFKKHFGLGDLVFLLVISPLFANQNFILFFITGTVFSGCMHVLMSQVKRGGETVPLAGYLSLYLIAIRSVDLLISKDLFYANLF